MKMFESVSEQLRTGPRYETRHDPINDMAHGWLHLLHVPHTYL